MANLANINFNTEVLCYIKSKLICITIDSYYRKLYHDDYIYLKIN